MTLLSVLSQDSRKVVLKFCVPEQLMALWRVLIWREWGSCASLLPPPGFWLPGPEMPYKILICLMSFTAFYCLVFKYGKSWGSSASVSVCLSPTQRHILREHCLHFGRIAHHVGYRQFRTDSPPCICTIYKDLEEHRHTHTQVMCLNSQLTVFCIVHSFSFLLTVRVLFVNGKWGATFGNKLCEPQFLHL